MQYAATDRQVRRLPLNGRARVVVTAVLVVSAALAAGCKDEGTVTVHSITFAGVHAVPESQLRNALATRVSSRLPFGRKRYFDRGRFDVDLQRIRAFYADHGYPNARVSGFDVKLNQQQDQVDVTLSIDEGQPITIAEIDFYGFQQIPDDRMLRIRQALPLKTGGVRDRQQIAAAQGAILDQLRDNGFAYARIWITEKTVGDRQIAVSVTADTGPAVRFGPIEIVGNTSVDDTVVAREMVYKAGDAFSRQRMVDTQRRLYGLELFQFVDVKVIDSDEQYPEVRTRVTVAEGKHQRATFGLGYGTEEKGRVDAEYRHVNFLGGARSAGVHGRYSSLDRGIRADVTQPYFLFRGYSLRADGQQWYTFTPAYRSIASGGKITLSHRPRSQRHSWSVSLQSEHDSSAIADNVLTDLKLRNALIALGLDPRTGEQNGLLNAVGFDGSLNGTDKPIDAHRGYQVALHVEQAGKIAAGTFQYFAISSDVRHYLPVGKNIVIGTRVQFGSIDGGGDETAIPFTKRLFLGGATSIRGWGRFEVSPLSDSGLPLGGESLFAFSSEVRAPASDKVELVAFLDTGNVWATPWTARLNDLRYAIGPGVRYATPVGPVRLDVGYQVNPIPGLIVNGQPQQRRWRLHFSIGQAF